MRGFLAHRLGHDPARQAAAISRRRPAGLGAGIRARMAATLDRLPGGRLLVNIVTGGDPVELKGDGAFLDHDERDAVTDEFLSILRRLMRGEEVTETHRI